MAPVAIGMAVAFAASAASSLISASQQKSAADQQARMYEQQAQQQRNISALQAGDIQRRADLAVGRQIASSGAAGVDVSGSIVDDLAQTRANAARDTFTSNYMGQTRADNLSLSASNSYAQGSQIMTNAFIGVGLKGLQMFGGSLMNGIGGAGGAAGSSGTGPSGYTGNIAGQGGSYGSAV